MNRTLLALIGASFLWLLGGCGGEFQLMAPDQLAAAGSRSDTVLRLMRNEFGGLMLPLKEAPLQVRVGEGPLVSARTDPKGYAAMSVPVGEQPGLFHLKVYLLDNKGREFTRYVPVYIMDPKMAVVAVDFDAVRDPKNIGVVREALERIASNAYIVYFTDESVARHGMLHVHLRQARLPDGAIVGWEQQAWHISGEGIHRRLVIEDRMVSPLAYLRAKFPQMRWGLAGSPVAARAFLESGMKAYMVAGDPPPKGALSRPWKDLAQNGL